MKKLLGLSAVLFLPCFLFANGMYGHGGSRPDSVFTSFTIDTLTVNDSLYSALGEFGTISADSIFSTKIESDTMITDTLEVDYIREKTASAGITIGNIVTLEATVSGDSLYVAKLEADTVNSDTIYTALLEADTISTDTLYNSGKTQLNGNLRVGPVTVVDNANKTIIHSGDADSDAAATTQMTVTAGFTANATPTSATYGWTMNQGAGYTLDKLLSVVMGGLATTPTIGLSLRNTTASLVGTTVQMSPDMDFLGHAWDVDNAVDRSIQMKWSMLPVSGNTCSGIMRLGFSLDGAATTYPFTVTSAGAAIFSSTIQGTSIIATSTVQTPIIYPVAATDLLISNRAATNNNVTIDIVDYSGADGQIRLGDTGNAGEYAVVDSVGIIYHTLVAGITATNPGAQGDNVLTGQVNVVATVGTADDAVTLPPCPATTTISRMIRIINNGANQLEIWPYTGDDAGAGVNNAITLAAGSNITLVSIDATNWETM